jgi:hypothetical protein
MPKSAASVCSSQLWLRPQVRHCFGCVDRISSRTVLRISVISASCVVMRIPSSQPASCTHAAKPVRPVDAHNAQTTRAVCDEIGMFAQRRYFHLRRLRRRRESKLPAATSTRRPLISATMHFRHDCAACNESGFCLLRCGSCYHLCAKFFIFVAKIFEA